MLLQMPAELAAGYKNPAQRARVVTEAWGAENLYCANCRSETLQRLKSNTPAIDFACPRCESLFQLKSRSQPFGSRIVDAAYDKMMCAIEAGRTPNLFALHYSPANWQIRDLILIPRFAFSSSSVQRRRPLGPRARRAGWVGCNLLLTNIPQDAKIPLIADGIPARPAAVRRQYDRLRPLAALSHETRGWTLDVLNMVRSLGKTEFSLAEVYEHEEALERLHPENRHVRPKIRQQLQVLRELGWVEFRGRGEYRTVLTPGARAKVTGE